VAVRAWVKRLTRYYSAHICAALLIAVFMLLHFLMIRKAFPVVVI